MSGNTDAYRERIIVSARAIFIRNGISRTSLNELCRQLHIAKKTFYVHFENKDVLLRAIIEDTLAQYATCVQQSADPHLSDFERARSVLVALCELSPQLLSATLLDELSHTHPDLWREVSAQRQRLIPVVFEWLAAAQDQGDVKSSIDLENLEAIAALLLDRVLDPVELERRQLPIAPTARLVFGLLFEGISAP